MSDEVEGLRFRSEWERPDNVTAPELAATWARLEIWADSTCVTQVEDAEVGNSRRGIYCSLYPLAEWVAFNWWLLHAHARPASLPTSFAAWSPQRRSRPPRWLKHHNLRMAGDGFAWPDLAVLPSGDFTRIVWRADRGTPIMKPIKYLVDGDAEVPSALVQRSLAQVVESVLARLEERGIPATPLADEWQAILDATPDEKEFCIAAARIGLDPYSLPTDLALILERAALDLEPDLLADFLDAVDPSKMQVELDWVNKTSREIGHLVAQPSTALATLRSQALEHRETASGAPWSRGWAQARRVREVVGLAPTEQFRTDGLMTCRRASLRGTHGLHALGGTTEHGGETLVLSRQYVADAKRFASARALWHFVHDHGSDRFLLTIAHGDRQRVARAFAAELLAPADGIRELLGDRGDSASEEDIDQVAAVFGVSSFVVGHQIKNQLAPV